MATTFEPVDADGVATDLLRFQGMPHGRAFVDHLDLSRLQRWHVLLRTAARRLHNFYAPFLDGGDVFGIGRLRETRQEGEIHPKWLVRHVATARDFLRQEFRRLLCKSGDDTEPPGAGYRRGELGKADVVHAPLDDRMPDAEQFSDRCLHEHLLLYRSVDESQRSRRTHVATDAHGHHGVLDRSISGVATCISAR